ncbi:MAG: SBBP repeat-containing protein [Leptospiraceae bacterium]|nr:SBBP repeat-containing protein [Leptospiraceae bacterium]
MRRHQAVRAGHICQNFVSLLLALLSFSACKNGSGADSGSSTGTGGSPVVVSPPVSKSLLIGIEGGEIVADDGSWKFTVPPFGLRFPQEIKITVDAVPVGTIGSEFKKVSKVFKFEPEGLVFDQPAKFWFKYDQADMVENSLQERMVGIYYVNNDSSLERTPSSVNTSLNEATSELKHFSFGVGLTIQILLVNFGVITNQNPVLNIANNIIAHFASLTTSPTPLQEYQNNQALIDAFIAKTEQILGYNPLFQAFPGIFPPGTTGGYSLTYDANGASSGTAPTDTARYAAGSNATVQGNTGGLALTNFTFAGWNTAADGSGTTYVAAASYPMPSSHVTLYARWVENPKYTISYSGNGSTGGVVPLDAGQYYTGTSVLVSQNTGGLYKNADLFVGWNTQADGSGASYMPGQAITVGAANISLFAMWQTRLTRLAGVATKPTRGQGIAVDAGGNIFVAGYTDGNLNGLTNNGPKDGFVIKYNRAGVVEWTRLIGPAATRSANALGVVLDNAGNVFVTGSTNGAVDGISVTGLTDTFIIKMDTNGTRLWTQLLGVAGAHTISTFGGVLATDADGNLIISGQTNGNLAGNTKTGLYDAYVAKYNAAGTIQWVRLSGVAGVNTNGFGVSADTTGNIYTVGQTAGNLDGQTKTGTVDAFIMKFDASGNKQWTHLTGATGASTMIIDVKTRRAGDVFMAGYSSANIDGQVRTGNTDGLLVHYAADGTKLWTRLHGVSAADSPATSIAIDPFDQVYLCGNTSGNLAGQIKTGTGDLYLAKFSDSGSHIYTRLLGGSGTLAAPYGCTSDASGNIHTVGFANGNLDGQIKTGTDDMLVTTNLMDTSSFLSNTVTYYGNGHSSGAVPVDTGTYLHGAPVLVKGNTGNLARTNHIYTGWNSQSNGSGNNRVAGKSFSMGPTSESIHAQWQQKWTRLSGSAGAYTHMFDLAVDAADNIISVGYSNGAPDGLTRQGGYDAYVTKHDSGGNKLWSKLMGSPGAYTFGQAATAATVTGRIILAGHTNGALNGQALVGKYDTFVVSLYADGSHHWTRLLGIPNNYLIPTGVISDNQGNIYVAGYTSANLDGQTLSGRQDGFITKYTWDGIRQWTRLTGVTGAYTTINKITSDGDLMYVVGSTNGNLHGKTNPGNYSAFISQYDQLGNRYWTTLVGGTDNTGARSNTFGYDIAVKNCGSVHITGSTNGTLGQPYVSNWGSTIGFVYSVMALNGQFNWNFLPPSYQIWSYPKSAAGRRLICSPQTGLSVLADLPAGGYSVSPVGSPDTFVYRPFGAPRVSNFGTSGASTYGTALAVDSRGVLYATGYINSSIDGQSLAGYADAFLTNRLSK